MAPARRAARTTMSCSVMEGLESTIGSLRAAVAQWAQGQEESDIASGDLLARGARTLKGPDQVNGANRTCKKRGSGFALAQHRHLTRPGPNRLGNPSR